MQAVATGWKPLEGHRPDDPLHVSARSQDPTAARHTVLALLKLQVLLRWRPVKPQEFLRMPWKLL